MLRRRQRHCAACSAPVEQRPTCPSCGEPCVPEAAGFESPRAGAVFSSVLAGAVALGPLALFVALAVEGVGRHGAGALGSGELVRLVVTWLPSGLAFLCLPGAALAQWLTRVVTRSRVPAGPPLRRAPKAGLVDGVRLTVRGRVRLRLPPLDLARRRRPDDRARPRAPCYPGNSTGVDVMDLRSLVLLRGATLAVCVLAAAGAVVGCKAPPARPPIGDTGVVPRDGGVDALPIDGSDDRADASVDATADGGPDAALDGGLSPPADGGTADAPDGGPVVHPGTGTWSACIPEAADRVCYFVPGAIAAGGTDTTVRQRIAIDLDGLIHESGSVPPFDLRVSPTVTEGEFLGVGSSSAGGGNYFDLMFMMGASVDGWVACSPSTRRFRVLQAGTMSVALEFELDCAAMPGVQLRGALVGSSTFSGWRTDPIDGL